MKASINGNARSHHPTTSLLKIGAVASRLGVSVQSIRNWIEAGDLESVRSPGGHRLIPESAVREFEGFDEQEGVGDEIPSPS